jgi:beta-mannosidase
MSFGWDIAPRLMTAGIWRPVELVLVDTARITDVHVTHGDPAGEAVRARIEVEVEWLAGSPGNGRVSGRIHETPFELSAEFAPGVNVVAAEAVLRDPPLWWPIGYGRPALCDVEVRLEAAGRVIDSHRSRIGIRRVELRREPQPGGAESFGFRCNGRDVFITGLNWTPLDALFARIRPERITRTLEGLAGIGCNMLRVWGGGIYEPQHFYDECDRLGIMVWQDFMMACGWYPQTEAFAERLSAEARQVVRDLRGHPCLCVWAGDNEVDAFYPDLAGQNRLTREVLAAVCRELDGDTVYLPSSPYSPSGADPQSPTEGDVHHYAHGQCYRACRLWGLRARFVSEFGHLSLPSMEVIGRYFPPGTAWPLTSPTWRYHAADTIREPRFRGAEKILDALAACGRAAPGTIEEAVEASQELQAEAVCAWIERWCRDGEFGGFLLWNVADCWPQQSDSVIDCEGRPKRIFARLGPLFERMRRRHAGRADP